MEEQIEKLRKERIEIEQTMIELSARLMEVEHEIHQKIHEMEVNNG